MTTDPGPAFEQRPPSYPFPPGTPEKVPEDFAAAHEAAVLASNQLTAEEVAEFRALRAEKKARDEQAAKEAAEAAAKLTPPTHYVHLADGSVIDGHQIATHYATADGRVIPVAAAFEKEPALA